MTWPANMVQNKHIKPGQIVLLMSLLLAMFFCCAMSSSKNLKNEVEMKKEELLELTISTEKNIYKIGETIEINCKLENISDLTLNLPPILHFLTLNLYFGKFGEDFVRLGSRYFIQELLRPITLKPKENYNFKEFIGDEESLYVLNLQDEGSYEFFLVYENSQKTIKNKSIWTGHLKSNTLVIEVIHRETKGADLKQKDRNRGVRP